MNAQKIKSIGDFLALFPAQPRRKAGNGWLVICPAHNDKNPSLWVTPSKNPDFIADWRCQAGCTREAVLVAAGLTWDDVRRNEHKSDDRTQKNLVATFSYEYEAGKEAYQIRRFDLGNGSKTFEAWHKEGDRYVAGMGEYKDRPILYHLPEIKGWIAAGKRIYSPEGELKADLIISKGGAATTSPFGAGRNKWRPEYSKILAGAELIILPDNDKPGDDFAQEKATSLYGEAASLKLLKLPGLPEKGDIIDWFNAGGTFVELERLASEAPEYKRKETAKKPKDTEGEVRGVSFAIVADCLYEQVYSNEQSAFVEYNIGTGEVKTVTHVMQGETKIIPQQGEELTLGAIKLPSGVTEYGDTLSLLHEIEAHIFRYLDVSDAFRKFAAYYILLSWLYDKFSTLPYIRAIGDTGCGKSRLLDVCGGLCYKPTLVSGCITPAPIYRMLKRWNGTMILDEADLQNSDEYSEVVKILNCGFERGRPVIRATKDNPDKLQFLPTFGPKVFATRRRFKDPALEARCLTEIMQETTRDDIPATLTSSFYKEQEALRNRLLLFRLRNYALINPEEAISLDLKGIEPRLRQISAGFASLFAGQPEVLADYQAFIQHHQRELIEQRAMTKIGQVVEKLFALTESVTNVTNVTNVTGEELIPISSKDIAEPLNMTPQAVGQILKTLGLRTRLTKIEGSPKRCIVYDAVKLDALKRRYIPSEDDQVMPDKVTMVTKVTKVTGLNEDSDNLPPYPTTPCNCGCMDYWLREASRWGKAEWVCTRCHPKPGASK